ncbi:MAG: hypothetical protein WA154_12285 [Moraxellaceae bacterium]
MSSLLPPNASRLERNVAQLSVAVTNLPVAIVDLHRVAAWSDSQKRQVI